MFLRGWLVNASTSSVLFVSRSVPSPVAVGLLRLVPLASCGEKSKDDLDVDDDEKL